MPRIDVPELGPLLRGWRKAQGRTQFQWALRLWWHGWYISPWRIARIVANAELTSQWVDTDPSLALGKFLKAAERGLIHSDDDREFFVLVRGMMVLAHQAYIYRQ